MFACLPEAADTEKLHVRAGESGFAGTAGQTHIDRIGDSAVAQLDALYRRRVGFVEHGAVLGDGMLHRLPAVVGVQEVFLQGDGDEAAARCWCGHQRSALHRIGELAAAAQPAADAAAREEHGVQAAIGAFVQQRTLLGGNRGCARRESGDAKVIAQHDVLRSRAELSASVLIHEASRYAIAQAALILIVGIPCLQVAWGGLPGKADMQIGESLGERFFTADHETGAGHWLRGERLKGFLRIQTAVVIFQRQRLYSFNIDADTHGAECEILKIRISQSGSRQQQLHDRGLRAEGLPVQSGLVVDQRRIGRLQAEACAQGLSLQFAIDGERSQPAFRAGDIGLEGGSKTCCAMHAAIESAEGQIDADLARAFEHAQYW